MKIVLVNGVCMAMIYGQSHDRDDTEKEDEMSGGTRPESLKCSTNQKIDQEKPDAVVDELGQAEINGNAKVGGCDTECIW